MFENISLSDIAKRLTDVVPNDLVLLRADLEKNFHAVLQAALANLNLVSREEFEVQKAVLARTREELQGLEARIAELEGRLPKE